MTNNRQALFDECVSKMVKQGEPCGVKIEMPNGNVDFRCLYSNDGTHCAAGLLMSKEALDVVKDGLTVGDSNSLAISVMGWNDLDRKLVSELQEAHDTAAIHSAKYGAPFMKMFLTICESIAGKHGLETTVLEGVQ